MATSRQSALQRRVHLHENGDARRRGDGPAELRSALDRLLAVTPEGGQVPETSGKARHEARPLVTPSNNVRRCAVRPRNIVLLAVLGLGLPSAVLAQGAIAGTVRDTSSAVLPGVTVEASSVALIEKARTVVTDGTGQYQIINLPPGQYILTFTLPGFNTVRREASMSRRSPSRPSTRRCASAQWRKRSR